MTDQPSGMWKCNIGKCRKPAYHREVIDGVVVIRCPKHLKEHLGFKDKNDTKSKHNSK